MSQKHSQVYFLNIIILIAAAFITPGISGNNLNGKCKSAKCMAFYKLCDEIKNRAIKTVDYSSQETCVAVGFRSTFNADVSGMCVGTLDSEKGPDKWNETSISGQYSNLQQLNTKYLSQIINSDCKVPVIANTHLVYESNQAKLLNPEEKVPNGTRIMYLCESGYTLEGQQLNQCLNSRWHINKHVECIKYCPPQDLQSITLIAECTKDGSAVSCEHHIKPGTRANLTCQVGYRKSYQDQTDTLECQEEGHWNRAVLKCEPICGREPITIEESAGNCDPKNITYIPWHVGIYQRFSGLYRHLCGGNILSEKVVLSVAHCFWDSDNQRPYDKSFYAVGAGKFYRNYYAKEPFAQFRDISEIVIPSIFKGKQGNYRGDIAILVLADFLSFSLFIAPICITWLSDAARQFPSGEIGKTAGWGKNKNNTFHRTLRVRNMQSSSFKDCKEIDGRKYAHHITTEKFCVLSQFGPIVGEGDSGGGFAKKVAFNNTNAYHLWGVLSIGVPSSTNCAVYAFASYTNVQYYKYLIENHLNANRPK